MGDASFVFAHIRSQRPEHPPLFSSTHSSHSSATIRSMAPSIESAVQSDDLAAQNRDLQHAQMQTFFEASTGTQYSVKGKLRLNRHFSFSSNFSYLSTIHGFLSCVNI